MSMQHKLSRAEKRADGSARTFDNRHRKDEQTKLICLAHLVLSTTGT